MTWFGSTGRLRAWAIIAVVTAAGCAPGATATLSPTQPPPTASPTPPTATIPPPTVTTEPTSAPTSEPTETPTATPEAELFQVGEQPVLRNGFAHARQFVDPGAVIVHEGRFHMFYNGIDAFPAPVGVGYATSEDGVTWTRQSEGPVFGPAAPDYPDEMRGINLFVTSGLVEPDGTWVLYYYTLTGSDFNGRQTIGRATAPEPTGPWTTSAQPLLEPGPADAWDSRQVSAPDVTRTDTGYVMYYDAASTGDTVWKIGRATSPDGVNWTKHDDPATTEAPFAESDPVLIAGAEAWPATRALDPNAAQVAGGWVMIYATNTGTGGKFIAPGMRMGYATSPDGITWTPADEALVIASRHSAWSGVYLITLAEANGSYYLYFDVASGAGTNIYLARHAGGLEP